MLEKAITDIIEGYLRRKLPGIARYLDENPTDPELSQKRSDAAKARWTGEASGWLPDMKLADVREYLGADKYHVSRARRAGIGRHWGVWRAMPLIPGAAGGAYEALTGADLIAKIEGRYSPALPDVL